jgi:hypothetical protein
VVLGRIAPHEKFLFQIQTIEGPLLRPVLKRLKTALLFQQATMGCDPMMALIFQWHRQLNF